MKKTVHVCIAFCLIFGMALAGCSQKIDSYIVAPADTQEPDDEPIGQASAEDPAPIQQPAEEWFTGSLYEIEAEKTEGDSPAYQAQIQYPETPYEQINQVILEKVAEEAKECQDICAEEGYLEFMTEYTHEPRLTMDYRAYRLSDQVVSVQLQGILTHPGTEEEIPRLICLNFLVPQQRLLGFSDIFYEERVGDLAILCIDALAANNPDLEIRDDLIPADSAAFKYVLLKEDGIEIYFLPGEMLDASLGLVTLNLTYAQLEGIIKPVDAMGE